MRKRYLALGGAILISGLLVMGAGSYLKYGILKPLELGQDKTAVELPFLLMTDAGLRFSVEAAMETANSPSVPTSSVQTTTNPAQDSTSPAEPTQDPAEATSEPSLNTEPTVLNTVPAQTQGQTEPTVPVQSQPQEPTEPSVPVQTQPPETTPVTVPTETVPETRPNPEDMDFSQGGVDLSWFDDVLFIGDSRTVGLREFAPSGNADYFCSVGMTVFDCKQQWITGKNFGTLTLELLLQQKQYGKIFINLGINEVGYPRENFFKAYAGLIDFVQQLQPDAKIILMGIMTVSRNKAASASYFSVDNIYSFNDEIAAMTDGEKLIYMDVNVDFADEERYLPDVMTGDGCHLYAKYYELWADWISYTAAQMGI